MGVRYRAAERGYLKSDAGGLWAGPGCRSKPVPVGATRANGGA